MSGARDDTSTQRIMVELTAEQVQRLDALRSERNLSRGELLGELVEDAKVHHVRRRGGPGRQKPNPWAQVWPG